MKKISERKVLNYINEIQKGKGGIYPYHVATDTALKFQISINEAIKYVSKHIREVLNENHI